MDLRLVLILLQVILISLKVMDFITDPWWVVLMPILAPLVVSSALGILFVAFFICAGREGRNQYRQHKRLEAMIKEVRR